MSPAKAPCIILSGKAGGGEWKCICTLQENEGVDGKEKERGNEQRVLLVLQEKEQS